MYAEFDPRDDIRQTAERAEDLCQFHLRMFRDSIHSGAVFSAGCRVRYVHGSHVRVADEVHHRERSRLPGSVRRYGFMHGADTGDFAGRMLCDRQRHRPHGVRKVSHRRVAGNGRHLPYDPVHHEEAICRNRC